MYGCEGKKNELETNRKCAERWNGDGARMKAFVFDTETSGLVSSHLIPLDKQPSIIEFYGATVNLTSGQVDGAINYLIKPPKPVSDEITKITGITNQDLQSGVNFASVADQIRQAIEMSKVVIAHNLSFDKEMIDLEFERLGQHKITWPRRLICTVEATIHLLGFRMSLSDLHAHLFGQPFKGAHRAKHDVAALIRCCVELHKRGLI